MRERNRLRRIAERLAANRPVRWEEEEAAASSEAERAAIRELRVLAAMNAFHDSLQSHWDAPGLESSVAVGRGVISGTGAAMGHASAPPALAPGTRWGALEILEWRGRGAFGEVYRARDTRLDRIVALKVLADGAPSSADEVVREARLMARVRHPHVVTVYGADRIDGRIGIWMEYLRGETLSRLLEHRASLDPREAALIGIDLCRALSAVHSAGIAHRDIKLANVMRAEGGRIVLMDFGLGREVQRGNRSDGHRLSGTPLFMAPEVLFGTANDSRSDIYSLGVVLFALVTGSFPVEAASFESLVARHRRGEARRARDLRPDLAEGFSHVLDRALSPDRSTRFRSAGEMEQALLQSLGAAVLPPAGERRARSRRWILAAIAVASMLVVLAATLLVRRPAGPGAATAPFRAQPDLTLVGEEAGALFGLEVTGVGDVDGDGCDDVLIGAPLASDGGPNAGRVFLYRGGRNGLEHTPSWQLSLFEGGADLGRSIAPFTDLNLDGLSDLVIAAPGATPRPVGRVLVFHGSRNGPARQPVQVLSGKMGEGFAYAISSGDVNHDGMDDLLVGAPGPEGGAGRAYLYLARGGVLDPQPTWTFDGPDSSRFGISVAVGGDLNNDGYGDAAIGAYSAGSQSAGTDRGAIYVFMGSSAGLDTTPTILVGRQPGSLFGRALYFADVDGDGFQDLFVGVEEGSNGESHEGVAEIYFGSPAGVMPYGQGLLEPNVASANFGGRAAAVGDVDGDGCDDLYAGALRYQKTQPRAGAAFIFRGSRQRAIRLAWSRVGPKGGSWYGAAGGAIGDVNGDGFPDFAVGAPSWDTNAGMNTGMVEIFYNTRRR
jgi:serine/threonine-protein kinase